jgi:hypothetical protein
MTNIQNTPWTVGPHPWPEQIGCCPLTGRPYSVHGANMYNVAAATSKDIAHLIAVAPDMLDALLLVESCPSAMAALDDATASLISGAIAKANGDWVRATDYDALAAKLATPLDDPRVLALVEAAEGVEGRFYQAAKTFHNTQFWSDEEQDGQPLDDWVFSPIRAAISALEENK